MKPLIQLDKQYKTRDGRDAIVHAIDGPRDGYPVIASVRGHAKPSWDIHTFTEEGTFSYMDESHKLDLIEVVPPWEGEVYIHENGSVRNVSYFSTSEMERLDASRDWRRIKVKQVEEPT